MNLPLSGDPVPADHCTTNEAARLAGCSLCSVYRWVRTGRVRGWRRVGRLVVSRSEVMGLFRQVEAGRRLPTTPIVSERRRERRRKEVSDRLDELGL